MLILHCSSSSSLALPILPPDFSTCHLPLDLPQGEPAFNCCAPISDKPPKPFLLQPLTSHNHLRIRRPAHTLDQQYAHKLNLAYKLMKSLPPHDPRSFIQQANIHCAYCNRAYLQPNSSTYFEIHHSWFFFSFHRWYIYFHERILAKLLGDDTFALPFWNYDHPDGARLPRMYEAYRHLFDRRRDPLHRRPLSVVNLDYRNEIRERPAREQLDVNLRVMYFVMVSGGRTQYAFFGEPLRAGDAVRPGLGTVEQSPHNTVHLWTGNRAELGWKDMGALYASARDPIFYAHHANLDRLWDVWKTIDPEIHQDIDDPDYLDSGFAFYDEEAELVHVKVRDSRDSLKLGYIYEEVENPWLEASPQPLSKGKASVSDGGKACIMDEVVSEPCWVLVERNSTAARMASTEEILAVGGIEIRASHAAADNDDHQKVDMNSAAGFDVFVNLPTADEFTTVACTEYAGSFSVLPPLLIHERDNKENKGAASLRLASLGFILKELDLASEDSLVATIVPRHGHGSSSPSFSISSISIHYLSTP